MIRKNELLKLSKLLVDENINRAVNRDIGKKTRYGGKEYRYTRFYRALQEGDVLKVAVFTRRTAKNRGSVPDCEIYINKAEERWLIYYPAAGKWGTAKINNINLRVEGNDYYAVKGYADKRTIKMVNDYFGDNGKKGVRQAVLDWQSQVRNKEREKKYISEIEQIDSVMELVPNPPKDFEDWIAKKAYKKHMYIFYKQNGYAKCTACGREVELKNKARHNQSGYCPSCRKEITYKAWGKQKTVKDRLTLGIIQKLKDESGYIYRRITSSITYRKDEDYKREVYFWENERFRTNNQMDMLEYFEFGEYKNTGVMRWCHGLNNGYRYYYGYSSDSILYERNLDKLFAGTVMEFYCIKTLLQHVNPVSVEPERMVHTLARNPEYERLIKVGLYSLTIDMMSRSLSTNKGEKKLWNYLGISKEYYKMAVEQDVKVRHVMVMQQATQYNMHLTYEQICFYKKYYYNTCGEIFKLGHPTKFYRYLKELVATSDRLAGDYIDYLEDLRVLGVERDKSLYFPKNFQAVHTQYAAMRRERDNEIEKATVRKKNKILKKLVEEISPIFTMEDESMQIVIPTSKMDFTKEGQNQHNCVAGYYERMIKRETVVVFLRKKENINQSYCTVELSPEGDIRQNRIACNREAPQEAQDFIAKLSKQVKLRLAVKAREENNRLDTAV